MNNKIRFVFIGLMILMLVGCGSVEMMEADMTVAQEPVQETVLEVSETAETKASTDAEDIASDGATEVEIEESKVEDKKEVKDMGVVVADQGDAVGMIAEEEPDADHGKLVEQEISDESLELCTPEDLLSVETVDTSGENFYAVYSETEMKEALNSGDLKTFFNMLNANSAATMGDTWEDEEVVQYPENEKQTSISVDFVDYMNARRVEQGLSAYIWSDSMAETALERAEEIVADFSHNGVRNCAGENLAMVNSSYAADWYDTFYSSEVHKLNMLDTTYHSAAAAVCRVGNDNYVVVLFGF